MIQLLATDPGAWNIIVWMVVLGVIGAVILWVVTTLMPREGSSDRPNGRPTESS
jgi:hypothetical protein